MLADDSLEVLECDHDDGHVVERLAHQAILKDALDAEATELVNADVAWLGLLLGRRDRLLLLASRLGTLGLLGSFAGQPDGLADVVVGQLVEDAVRGQRDEVMLLRDLERLDVRDRLHHIRVAAAIL